MTLHWRHRWVAASVDTLQRTPTGLERRSEGDWRPVTLVLSRCTRCPSHRTEELAGHWTLQDLTGRAEA